MSMDLRQVNLEIVTADQQIMIYAYWRLLRDLVYARDGQEKIPTEEELERIRELLELELPQVKRMLVCECGHVKADHDDNGCNYIMCRNICHVKANQTEERDGGSA